MPLNPHQGESKDEYTSRCIKTEIDNGKPQDQAVAICIVKADEHFSATSSVSDNTWSTEAPINVNFAKVSFDYDETLSTDKGMEMAKRAIERGDDVYIISARRDKTGMLTRAKELGIPPSRVFATGSNKAKAEKVKELGITRHIDNNGDVVKSLPGIGEKFGRVRRVIFNEDFDEEIVRQYKEKGFKVQIRSSRKIQKKDRKVWNKLKSVGLTEDALVFGDLRDLNKKYDYELMFTGEDPMLEKLLTLGKVEGKYIGEPVEINSMEEAIKAQDLVKTVEMKFVTVSVVYVYQERPNVAPAQSGSRPFCTKLLATPNREYTLDEIQNLPVLHLKKMGLPEDPFLYRGGFYTTPGGVRGVDTTPFCRHQWVAKVRIN